ncbi:MAG: hypothetical protein U5O15_08990 [Candidatus Krumholzibacteriota bacterium]|nr:hypothetical protein [Candidatus Krumholzibacteriota bacterium]
MKKLAFFIIISAIVIATAATAQIPKTINYQGVLTDNGGTVVADGDYDLTFNLYTVATGGSSIWNCTETVTVTKGIFSAVLGESCVLAPSFDTQYYLGISVEGGTELTPRTALTASAYSLNAMAVTGTDNVFPATGNVGIGTASPGSKLEIHYDNLSSNNAAIEIDNNTTGGQNVLSFAFNGTQQAGLRKADGGDLFVSSLNALSFVTYNSNRMRILSGGNVGIGTIYPHELLDVAGGIKLGSSTGTNAGTMRWTGSDFEGYDGGSWQSLTSGGASLPSGTSGQTLRHNGSSWTASSAIYNDGTNIGIDDATPETKLDISGGEWDLDNTEGDFKIGDENYRLKFGVATEGGGAGSAGIRVQGGLNNLILGAGSREVLHVDSTGTVGVGSSLYTGNLKLYQSGFNDPLAVISPHYSSGGQVSLYDEAGNSTISMMPDVHGVGGYFYVRRSTGSTGFSVDGNYSGTENPRVGIMGASRSAYFNMDSPGNSSVSLPANSISNSEILDEPGAASYIDGLSSTEIGAEATVIGSRSITVPASGYVLVMSSAQLTVYHTNGTYSRADFGVSDNNSSLPSNQDIMAGLPSDAATGYYNMPITGHGLFEVASAGTYTYYFLGDLLDTGADIEAYDTQLTLIYIPTSYGTVSPTLAGGGDIPEDNSSGNPGMTEADITAERTESIAANEARVEKELAEIRERMEKLEREMGNNK